jgi:tetratricopeptide (TPR) repeat protein
MEADVSSTTWFFDLIAWVHARRKHVMLGAVAVVGLGLIAGLIIYQVTQREVRASKALSDVRVPPSPTGALPPGLADAYLKVAKDHAGTEAAARAILQAAGTLFAEGNYREAQTQFERVTKEYPTSAWQAQALLGVAASLQAQRQYPEALIRYEELRRRYASAPVMDEAKLNMGRIYEAQGKHAEAWKLYDELAKASPYTGFGSEAGVRKSDLEEKYPELAQTNAPPPVVTPTLVATNLPGMTATTRVATATGLVQQAVTNLPRAATNLLQAATNAELTTSNLIKAVSTNVAALTNAPAGAAKP